MQNCNAQFARSCGEGGWTWSLARCHQAKIPRKCWAKPIAVAFSRPIDDLHPPAPACSSSVTTSTIARRRHPSLGTRTVTAIGHGRSAWSSAISARASIDLEEQRQGALTARSTRASHARRGAREVLATARFEARASRSIVLLKRAEALSRRRAVARALLGVAAPSITAPVVSCRPRRVQWLPPRERRRVRPFHSWTAVWARERGPGEARVAGFDEEVRRIHGTGAPCAVRRRRRT